LGLEKRKKSILGIIGIIVAITELYDASQKSQVKCEK